MHNYAASDILGLMVQRTTVVLPEDLLNKLRRIANERGISFAALLREAAEEKARTYRPKAKSFGLAASGKKGIARRASELYRPDPWRS